MRVFWQVAAGYGGTILGPLACVTAAAILWAAACIWFSCCSGLRMRMASGWVVIGIGLGVLAGACDIYTLRKLEFFFYGGALHFTAFQQLDELRIAFKAVLLWNTVIVWCLVGGFGFLRLNIPRRGG